jgi:hypothetical protein
MATIVISIILVVVGVLGTFGTVLPDQVGVFAFIAAGLLMLLGIYARGI